MIQAHRVYLDNAATSWPKPQSVYDSVDDYQRRLGVSVGRGGYAEAEEVGRAVNETRAAIARLIGAENPERIVFTFNGTDSLNLAIHGLLKKGDHVITTVVEHNSVLRPLRKLEKSELIEVSRIGCDLTGVVRLEDIQRALRPNTKLIIVTHASNVTGAIQPIADIGQIAREHGALFLVDAAQTIGHMPISVSNLGADLLAAPGHKGLLGPLGTGILYVRPGVEKSLECIRQGGTGSASSSDEHPVSIPEKYEAGNHNTPGIVGLGAGVAYIEERGIESIREHAVQLTELLLNGLLLIPGVKIYGPQKSKAQIGVVGCTLSDLESPKVAKWLEEEFRVQVRPGFQCAALMHRSLGTIDHEGTVRLSIGPFNTENDIGVALDAVARIAKSKTKRLATVTCPCVSVVDQITQASSSLSPSIAERTSSLSSKPTDVAAIEGLQELWKLTLGDPSVCIAVLDGPVDLSHSCFRGASVQVHPSSLSKSTSSGAAAQHGTHVASVIFGQHHSDVKGFAPRCRGIAITIFQDGSDGVVAPCTQSELANAIMLAVEAGANIINISGGQFSPSGDAHPALVDAVNKCGSLGVLLVAAAGNEGCRCLHLPGALPTVLAVGAMNLEGSPLGFSNWGYGKQGLLAIGDNIVGAIPGGNVVARTGTSFAAPVIAGVSGLLMSLRSIRGVKPNARTVRTVLLATSLGCDRQNTESCARLLAGRLNIPKAISLIKTGVTTMSFSSESVSANAAERGEATVSPYTERDFDSPTTAVASVGNNEQLSVVPAGCGCTNNATGSVLPSGPVFVIGQISHAFLSDATKRSMSFASGANLDLEYSVGLFRHLRGWNDKSVGHEFPGRNFDISKFVLTVRNSNKTQYVIFPSGYRSDEQYDLLLEHYAEQDGLFKPSSLQSDSEKYDSEWKLDSDAKRIDETMRPQFFAFPGFATGKSLMLANGISVPTLIVDVGYISSWNIAQMITRAITDKWIDKGSPQENGLRQALAAATRLGTNRGFSPEDRALNAVIAFLDDALKNLVQDFLPQNTDGKPTVLAFKGILPPKPVEDDDSRKLLYEVTALFYNPQDSTQDSYYFRWRVDVADAYPRFEDVGDARAGFGI